jgi:hypothetical protein
MFMGIDLELRDTRGNVVLVPFHMEGGMLSARVVDGGLEPVPTIHADLSITYNYSAILKLVVPDYDGLVALFDGRVASEVAPTLEMIVERCGLLMALHQSGSGSRIDAQLFTSMARLAQDDQIVERVGFAVAVGDDVVDGYLVLPPTVLAAEAVSFECLPSSAFPFLMVRGCLSAIPEVAVFSPHPLRAAFGDTFRLPTGYLDVASPTGEHASTDHTRTIFTTGFRPTSDEIASLRTVAVIPIQSREELVSASGATPFDDASFIHPYATFLPIRLRREDSTLWRNQDYWAATPGNVGAIMAVILEWCRLHPDAVFSAEG